MNININSFYVALAIRTVLILFVLKEAGYYTAIAFIVISVEQYLAHDNLQAVMRDLISLGKKHNNLTEVVISHEEQFQEERARSTD